MEFETRPASVADRDQLYWLYVSVLKDHITKIWGWDESWQQGDFNDHFVPEHIQVAIANGQVIGYIHVDPGNRTPHLRMMCVATEYQRKGIGTALLESLIQDCAAKGQDLALLVFRINAGARSFYEKTCVRGVRRNRHGL